MRCRTRCRHRPARKAGLKLIKGGTVVDGSGLPVRTCSRYATHLVHSFVLAHWVRDRKRGPRMSVEEAVNLITRKTALSVGMLDRGLIAAGMKADINVVDLSRLKLLPPEFHGDLPAGARRIMQKVEGYRATLVSGVITREYDEDTGVRPGRLLRRP